MKTAIVYAFGLLLTLAESNGYAQSGKGLPAIVQDLEERIGPRFSPACGVSIYATLPKDHTLAPPDTPRWIAHSFYVAKTDTVNTPPRLKAIFLCSIMFYLAVIYLAGPLIVQLFVYHRIIWRCNQGAC